MSERSVDDERSVGTDQVRREQMAAVDVPLQWAYLIGVLVGGLLSMIAFIALLGGSA